MKALCQSSERGIRMGSVDIREESWVPAISTDYEGF